VITKNRMMKPHLNDIIRLDKCQIYIHLRDYKKSDDEATFK
jgi:hypothetical protein